MKQSKRLLAVLLAMIMTLSMFTIAASAYKTDYSEPAGYDSVLDPYFTNDQAASALLDYLDDKVFAPMNVHESVVGIDIDITSFDTLCDSVDEIMSSTLYGIGSALLNLGDIEDMNWSALRNGNNRRRSASLSDLQFFMIICGWASTNSGYLCKIVDNTLDLGIIGNFFDLGASAPMLKNLHGYVNDIAYKALLNNNQDTGYVVGDPDTYNLDNTLQTFLNDHCIKFIFDLLDADTVKTVADFLGIQLNDEGKVANDMGLLDLLPSLSASDISITATSTYDMLINIVNALIDDIVIPYAGTLILDLLGIDPEDPAGDTSYIDIAINLFVDYQTLVEAGAVSAETPEEEVNVVEEFLRWRGVENPESPKPIDKTDKTLEYILKIGIKKFIHFETHGTKANMSTYSSQLQLTEYFSGMFSDLIRMVLPMLPSLASDFAPLTAEETAAIETMSDEQLFAFALKMVLSTFIEGVYFPEDCDTIRELATYTLVNVCEELVHSEDCDFDKEIELGMLDPNSDQCLDVAAAVLNYYLVGQTTFVSDELKPTFVELLNDCFETFLGKYVSLFSMYPNATDQNTYRNNPWYKLYMSVNQWIPLTNIFYGVEDSWYGMQNLFMDSIIGNVLDFDINGLLGIVGRRPDSDLNKPFSQLVANLLGRVINGVFKLPTEKNSASTNAVQKDQLIIPYDYTRLDQILVNVIDSSTTGYTASINGCGLKNTARMLFAKLPNITQPGAVAAEALDVIAELIGVIDLDAFAYHRLQYDSNSNGVSYSINELKDLYAELEIPSNEGLKYYDEDFTFCHTVDFDPWTYKDFKKALGTAAGLIEAYDKGENVLRSDISYAYYVLRHTHDDWLLTNQPAANNFYLNRIMSENPRIAANVDENNEQLYTNRSWDAYIKAYNFAERVNSEYDTFEHQGRLGDYPQSKVNEARKQLRDAIFALKLNAGLGDADYTLLQQAIQNLVNLDSPAVFTSKSVAAVVEAYNEALAFVREVWYDADSQQIVDGVTERLNKAYQLLVNIPTISFYDENYKYFNTDEVNSYLYGFTEPLFTAADEADFGDFTTYLDFMLAAYPTNGCTDVNIISTENGNGTGARVQLRSDEDGDGVLVTEREYTVVYFGDVNGDGNADGMDAVIIRAYAARLLSDSANSVKKYAADVDCDDLITATDVRQVERAGVYRETIDQAPAARSGNTIAFTDLVNQ